MAVIHVNLVIRGGRDAREARVPPRPNEADLARRNLLLGRLMTTNDLLRTFSVLFSLSIVYTRINASFLYLVSLTNHLLALHVCTIS